MNEADLYAAFGRRVAVRRVALALTQAGLATKVDMSRASIANIERGNQRVSLHMAVRIGQALGLGDIGALLPSSVGGQSAEEVRILEPDGGMSEEARRQVAVIWDAIGDQGG